MNENKQENKHYFKSLKGITFPNLHSQISEEASGLLIHWIN